MKFTMEHSFKELQLSDIFIKNENGPNNTGMYHKSIHTQQYFHFNSTPREKKTA